MAATHSLFALDEDQSEDTTMATVSVLTRLRSVGLALVTGLAGLAVLFDELVVWAGQPSGDPTGATVSAWYDAHAGRVLVGDLLWLAVFGVLGAALWSAVSRFDAVPRWTARAVGLAGITCMAASSLFAARIVLGVGGDLTSWELEGSVYRAGTVLLALTMVPLADGLRQARRTWLAGVAVAVGFALAIPPTSLPGLVAAFVLVAVVLGVRPARAHAPA